MTKMTITRGVSGSGKSTWAESQRGAVIVSRDRTRVSLFGSDGFDYYEVDKAVLRKREELVTKVNAEAMASALAAGIDVINDDTNIEWKYVKPIAEIAWKAGVEIVIRDFDVPLYVALRRNDERGRAGGRDVPHFVIEKQHSRFQSTKGRTAADLDFPKPPRPYNGTPGKPTAVLVDIDGTLAHMNGKRGPFDWKKVGVDDPDDKVIDLVNTVYYDANFGHKVILMSGRDAVCRGETLAWLDDNQVPFDHLFMRPEKDMRKDSIVKAELFDQHVRDNFDVQFVLDDRDQVVDMWRSMGLKCLQVAPGNF